MTVVIGDEAFRRDYSSYLSNVKPGLSPAHGRPGTCRVCGGPVTAGYDICRQCQAVRIAMDREQKPFPLDWLAFLTYAVEGVDLANRAVPDEGRLRDDREGEPPWLKPLR